MNFLKAPLMTLFATLAFQACGLVISVNTAVAAAIETPVFKDGFENEFPPPSITSFLAEPASITEGETTTLSWTTVNAVSCTPSGGTGNWDTQIIEVPDANVDITVATAGTHEFTLTCEGGSGDFVVDTTTVEADARFVCPTPALSDGVIVTWENFWEVSFPNPVYKIEFTTVPRKGYKAIMFNTADVIDDGKLSLLETTITTGLRIGTISRCPGDFDASSDCSYTWGLGGGISWATNGRSGACPLMANTDYYFNFTFTDGVDDTTSRCKGVICRVEVQHINP